MKVISLTLSEALRRRGQFFRTVNIILSIDMSQKYFSIGDFDLNRTFFKNFSAKPCNFRVVTSSKRKFK